MQQSKIIQQIKDNVYALLIVVPSIVCYIIGYFIDIKPFIIHGHQDHSWQLFTYLFFSTSLLHLVINSSAIFLLFDAFKDYNVISKITLFIIILFAGFICGVYSILFNPIDCYTAGSSGAIYFGFTLLMFEELRIGEKSDDINHKLGWIVFWLINIYSNYAMVKHGYQIDIINHLSGFLFGILVCIIVVIMQKINTKWNSN